MEMKKIQSYSLPRSPQSEGASTIQLNTCGMFVNRADHPLVVVVVAFFYWQFVCIVFLNMSLFSKGISVAVLCDLLLTVTILAQLDCSDYTVDRSTDLPYAYRFFPKSTVASGNGSWSRAQAFCAGKCGDGCQMAIIRNVSTTAFLLSLQAVSNTVTYIGLQNSSGTWTWIDGQVCDPNLITDERCYGNCQFDSNGKYGNLNQGYPRIDDVDEVGTDGSVFCEVKCKCFSIDP
jgi:hypothetical protein